MVVNSNTLVSATARVTKVACVVLGAAAMMLGVFIAATKPEFGLGIATMVMGGGTIMIAGLVGTAGRDLDRPTPLIHVIPQTRISGESRATVGPTIYPRERVTPFRDAINAIKSTLGL